TNGKGYTLELLPRTAAMKRVFQKLSLEINEQLWVTRTDMLLPNGDRIVTTYSNQTRAPVPASTFEFTPPPGTEVSTPLGGCRFPRVRPVQAASEALALRAQMREKWAAMAGVSEQINSAIEGAVADGKLMESAAANIRALLTGARTVTELLERGEWQELNDRFYRTLAFGTGGLRGRTIGKIVTKAERGEAREDERPQFPCVGTNAMNFFNINRAMRGLVAYIRGAGFASKLTCEERGAA